MQTLQNAIRAVEFLRAQSLGASANGAGVDMGGNSFDSAFALVSVGAITGTPTSVTVKFEESDASDFGSGVTDMLGGAAVTVTQNTAHTFQLERRKRYARMVVTITGGTTPTVIIAGQGVLANWARPFTLA